MTVVFAASAGRGHMPRSRSQVAGNAGVSASSSGFQRVLVVKTGYVTRRPSTSEAKLWALASPATTRQESDSLSICFPPNLVNYMGTRRTLLLLFHHLPRAYRLCRSSLRLATPLSASLSLRLHPRLTYPEDVIQNSRRTRPLTPTADARDAAGPSSTRRPSRNVTTVRRRDWRPGGSYMEVRH